MFRSGTFISALALALQVACASEDSRPGTATATASAPLAPPPVPDSIRAQVAARTLTLMRGTLLDSTGPVLAIADGSPATHHIQAATLCSIDCGTWERDSFDLEYRGTRVTQADGLEAISREKSITMRKLEEKCLSAAASLPDSIASLPAPVRPTPQELCALYLYLAGTESPAERVEEFFVSRRAFEIRSVYTFLSDRIGPLTGPLSADRERAVMYLGRLAGRIDSNDGALGDSVVERATASTEWRNGNVEANNITADMAEELAARASLGRMEAQFSRNMAESARIRAEKAARTPYESAEAWRSVCTATIAAGLISASDAARRGC